jgi:hypothetical protein
MEGVVRSTILGRLRRDIDQCITGYTRFCRHILDRKK